MLAIPAGAVGIFAKNNENPLEYRSTIVTNNLFDVTVIDDTLANVVPRNVTTHQVPNYLGAILSQDRTEVIWLNDSKPLP